MQRPVADDDAGGVRRGVGIEALQLFGDLEQARDLRIALGGFLQFWLACDRLLQRDGLGRVLRDELGEPVHLAERHLQDPPDVTQHAAREKRAEGDDLRNAVGAVAALHIGDHLVAAALAEIDVEVRHRHAFGIEEALEQKRETHGVEVGDGERVGDQRARAGATARPHGNALLLRVFDEVRDDQEVAGEFHLLDDVEFEGEPRFVVSDREIMRGRMRRETRLEPLLRLAAQFLRLGRFGVGSRCIAGGESRQDRLTGLWPVRTAQRDGDGIVCRLGEIGEKRAHFRARLEAVLGRQTPSGVILEHGSIGNAEQRVMRIEIGARGEVRLVGRHQGQPAAIGHVAQIALGLALGIVAVALDLDIEAIAEHALQAREAGAREIGLAFADQPVDRA